MLTLQHKDIMVHRGCMKTRHACKHRMYIAQSQLAASASTQSGCPAQLCSQNVSSRSHIQTAGSITQDPLLLEIYCAIEYISSR
jgi:hypothetical protein